MDACRCMRLAAGGVYCVVAIRDTKEKASKGIRTRLCTSSGRCPETRFTAPNAETSSVISSRHLVNRDEPAPALKQIL